MPEQADTWFKAFNKAKEMCGALGIQKRIPPDKEIKYLDALVRGVYAKRDLPEGHVLKHDHMNEDFYLAVPLQKGQFSCRELMSGEILTRACNKDEPLLIDAVDSPYSTSENLRKFIYQRGL